MEKDNSSCDLIDIWIRAANSPTGETYNDYIICCVDNIFCISHNSRQTMVEIQMNMNFRKDNIEDPGFYLDAI